MLKGLSEPVRLREKGNGQRAIEGPFYTCIEKIKLGAGQLPFSEGAMERQQHKPQQGVFKDLKIRLYRFCVDANISRNLREIQNSSVHLRGDFEKITEWFQFANDLFIPDFFLQIRSTVSFEVTNDQILFFEVPNLWQ